MADPIHAQQQKSGKPWSGTNKIPNINEFVANLDRSKAERDKAIDQNGSASSSAQVTPHKNEKPKTKGKEVTDPVTGKQIVIADVGKEYMKRADNPMVFQIFFSTSSEILSFMLTSGISYQSPMPI